MKSAWRSNIKTLCLCVCEREFKRNRSWRRAELCWYGSLYLNDDALPALDWK